MRLAAIVLSATFVAVSFGAQAGEPCTQLEFEDLNGKARSVAVNARLDGAATAAQLNAMYANFRRANDMANYARWHGEEDYSAACDLMRKTVADLEAAIVENAR